MRMPYSAGHIDNIDIDTISIYPHLQCVFVRVYHDWEVGLVGMVRVLVGVAAQHNRYICLIQYRYK